MKNRIPDISLEELLQEDASDMIPENVEYKMQRQLEAFRERFARDQARPARSLGGFCALFRRRTVSLATVSAVIVIGLIVGVIGVDNRSTLAFAQVLEQIRTFRPYSYTQTVKAAGEPEHSERVLYWSLTRRRQEQPGGRIYIFDLGSKPPRSLFLMPSQKLAVEETYTAMSSTCDPDLLKNLSEIQAGKEEQLGAREIEGHQTYGFHIRQGENVWTVWADANTGLPVRIELGHPKLANTIIMSNFKFDEKFDEALFSTQAPAGYTVQKIERNTINATEQHFIEGLRAVAGFLGGKFPVAFDTETLHDLRRPNQSDPELKALATKTQHALRYIEMLKLFYKVRDYTYQGSGVKLGERTPIAWWLPQGTDKYHVIYGDLSVGDVASSDLPKVNPANAAKAPADPGVFLPCSYTSTAMMDDGTSSSNRMLYLTLSKVRGVDPNGDYCVTDLSQEIVRCLEVYPAQHKATLKTIPIKGPTKEFDPVGLVRRLQDGSEQELEDRVIGGRQARGFHAVTPGNDIKAWLDKETGLPLLIEITHVAQKRKIIISDFKFDEKFDESLFNLTPPPGYTMEEIK